MAARSGRQGVVETGMTDRQVGQDRRPGMGHSGRAGRATLAACAAFCLWYEPECGLWSVFVPLDRPVFIMQTVITNDLSSFMMMSPKRVSVTLRLLRRSQGFTLSAQHGSSKIPIATQSQLKLRSSVDMSVRQGKNRKKQSCIVFTIVSFSCSLRSSA